MVMQVYYNYIEYIQVKNLWASLGGNKRILIKDPWTFWTAVKNEIVATLY